MLKTRRGVLITGGAAVAAFAAASTIDAMFNEIDNDVILKTYKLEVPQWPKGFELNVGYLTDIHLGLRMDVPRLKKIVEFVNAQEFDVIGLGGDYIDSSKVALGKFRIGSEDLENAFKRIAPKSDPDNVFAIWGNHDWEVGIGKLGDLLRGAKIFNILRNEARSITKDGQRVWIAAFDSVLKGRPDALAATRQIPQGQPVLAMVHEGEIISKLPKDIRDKLHVALAGHTHGAQVRIGSFTPFAPLVSTYRELGQLEGARREGDCQMIISPGVGCSRIPLRIGVPPEITRLHLTGTRPS